MSNILIDPENDLGDIDQLEKNLSEAVRDSLTPPAPKEEAPVEEKPAPVADNLPSKLHGKSLEEIAQMYTNLESAYGRMANDLGTQRKLTDRLLDLKRSDDLEQNTPKVPERNITSTDLLDNPKETLDEYFNRRMAELEQKQQAKLAQMETSFAEQQFNAKYGAEAQALGQDPQFAQFIQGTPLRTSLAQKAASGDYEAANALMEEWHSVKSFFKPATPEPKAEQPKKDSPLEAARQAQLESASGGKEGMNAGKTYRRAELIELRLTKPHLFEDEAFQAEIMRAYAEGRVR